MTGFQLKPKLLIRASCPAAALEGIACLPQLFLFYTTSLLQSLERLPTSWGEWMRNSKQSRLQLRRPWLASKTASPLSLKLSVCLPTLPKQDEELLKLSVTLKAFLYFSISLGPRPSTGMPLTSPRGDAFWGSHLFGALSPLPPLALCSSFILCLKQQPLFHQGDIVEEGLQLGGGSRNKQPHTLKRLGSSGKGAPVTLGTQRGAWACATQPDAHSH